MAVGEDGFLIDKGNLYNELGPETIGKLSLSFYTRVYGDDDESHYPHLGSLFRHIPLRDAVRNQVDFLTERLGGPALFSERKGHPALRARHARFRITATGAELWLGHMKNAVSEVIGEPPASPAAEALLEFFQHSAFFLVNADEPDPVRPAPGGRVLPGKRRV